MKKFTFISLSGILLVFLAISVMTTSCKSKREENAERRIERAIENATDEQVDIDIKDGEITIKTEEGEMDITGKEGEMTIKMNGGEITATDDIDTWPDEIPDDIPEFTYGDIIMLTTSNLDGGHGWTMVFENVPDDAFDKYKKDLDKKGFEAFLANLPNGGSISAEKNKIHVAAMGGEGNASVSIQVEE